MAGKTPEDQQQFRAAREQAWNAAAFKAAQDDTRLRSAVRIVRAGIALGRVKPREVVLPLPVPRAQDTPRDAGGEGQ